MHAPVEGVKKIMSHCRSVAPNFVTAETPPRKWAATCAFLFSPSICAFCPEPVSFHSSNLCRMPPPKRLQDPPFAATGFLGAASPQGQSSCTSLTLQRCHVPELCVSLTWAAPHPDRAVASPKEVLSSHQKELQELRLLEDPCENSPAESKGWENRAGVPQTALSPLLWSLTASPLFLPTL